jgi:hypothetical protein
LIVRDACLVETPENGRDHAIDGCGTGVVVAHENDPVSRPYPAFQRFLIDRPAEGTFDFSLQIFYRSGGPRAQDLSQILIRHFERERFAPKRDAQDGHISS